MLLAAFAASALPDTPYEEVISHRYTYHGAPLIGDWAPLLFDGPVLQAVPQTGGGALLRTAEGLWSSADAHSWHPVHTSFGASGLLLGGGANAVAHEAGVSVLSCDAAACKETLVAKLDDAACASSLADGWMNASTGFIAIGCSSGLLTGVAAPSSPRPLAREASVPAAVIKTAGWGGHLVAVTADRLHWRGPDGAWWMEWISSGDASVCTHSDADYAGGAVEGVPTALAFDGAAQQLYLGHDRGLQVLDLQTSALRRFDPIVDGLPVTNVSSACLAVVEGAAAGDGGGVWLGTEDGLARLPSSPTTQGLGGGVGASAWQFYGGRRWLPSDGVSALVALRTPSGGARLLAATSGGLAVLEPQPWTLARKAAHYQAMVSPRHDRYGFVTDCGLDTAGDLSSYVLHDSDNDGLWTGMYGASQAFRFAVTRDAAARDEALKRLHALYFLFQVAAGGPPRFPARAVARVGDTIYSGGADCAKDAPHCWRNSTATPGWVWKADTSSDEISGHMFVYPIYHRLLGGEAGVLNASEAAALRATVDGLVGGIVAANMTLIDPATAAATTWGKWSPKWLDATRSWSDDRGLRALELLSYLAGAEEVTGDARYRRAAEALRATHGYGRMMVNAKITDPCDDNHSDDEEAFLPLYTYLVAYAKLGRKREPDFDATLARFCRVTRREGASLYLAVCALAGATGGDVAGAPPPPAALAENLRSWPLELIKWDTVNSRRADLRHRPPPLDAQSSTAVPPREAARFRWNADPYRMDDGSRGLGEGDPGAWLLSYWLARYHGLLDASA